MSASDLPEQLEYTTSHDMALALVKYLACPYKVRRAIKQNFNSAPGITTIERMRQAYLNGRGRDDKPSREAFYSAAAEARKLDEANATFLKLLEQERARI